MMFIKLFTVFAAGIVSAFLPMITPTGKESPKPRTFLLKIENLELTKKLWKEKTPVITQSMNTLTRQAEKTLIAGPYTVTTGKHLPPGGNPHDFFGFAPFYWPIQFRPDGSQPFEMIRRNNYHYHIFNLEAAFDIAQLADHFDHIDIWTFDTKKGAGLRRSFEFLFPYLINQWQWNHFKRKHFNIPVNTRFKLLRKASIGFNEPEFEEAGGVFSCLNDIEFVNLTHPNAAIKR
jgi:hypothetical protein